MRRNLILSMVVVGLLFGFVPDAEAASWTAGGANDRWDNPANWNPDVPGSGDFAVFTDAINPQVAEIDSGTAAVAARVLLGDNEATDDSTLNQTGGTFNVAGEFNVGWKGKGTFNLTDGTATVGSRFSIGGGAGYSAGFGTATVNGAGAILNVGTNITMGLGVGGTSSVTQQLNLIQGTITADDLYVGDATGINARVDMTGGTMTFGDLGIITNAGAGSPVTGHFQLDGGIVNVTNATTFPQTGGGIAVGFRIRTDAGQNGSFDITGGTLILEGDAVATIDGYVGSGHLTGYGGAGTISRSFDGSNTTVTAIPEPGSLTLAALGLLSLVACGRRRRDKR